MTTRINGLEEIVSDLNEKLEKLTEMIKILRMTQTPYPKKTIDLEKLRKMYNAFVVMGIRISENNWEWPEEFKQNIHIRKDGIDVQEMEMINESLSGVLAELSSSEEDFDISEFKEFPDEFTNLIF